MNVEDTPNKIKLKQMETEVRSKTIHRLLSLLAHIVLYVYLRQYHGGTLHPGQGSGKTKVT